MKRKSVALYLSATILTSSFLGVTIYAQEQGTHFRSTQTTATENSILYSNSKMGFSLQIPNTWKNQYEVNEQNDSVTFVHKASKNALKSAEGALFSIVRYDGKMTQNDIVGAGVRQLILVTDQYSYVLAYPSGVEYDDTTKSDYIKMQADVEAIGKSIKSISTPTSTGANTTAPKEAQTAKWIENNPSIAISNPNDTYDVTIHDINSESIDKNVAIRQLMVNGGFVPNPQIMVRSNSTFVPLRVISEILGAKVDWSEPKKAVTITDGDTIIVLTIGNDMATVNGAKRTLDVPPTIENGKTYVPIRFISEVLGANVTYVPRFGGNGAGFARDENLKPVSVVVIERVQKSAKFLSQEEGLVAVKKASKDAYDELKQYLKNDKRTFDETHKDYDSQDITYKEEIGRYYVYTLKAFSGFHIYFNKYTGEIYSESAGLPFLFIQKGFINISWLYQ